MTHMTAEQFKSIKLASGLTYSQLADKLWISDATTVRQWASGKRYVEGEGWVSGRRPISGPVAQLMLMIRDGEL